VKFSFKKFVKWFGAILVTIAGIIVCFYIILNLATEPSNERTWNEDQKILPHAEMTGNLIMIYNVRNFSYASTTSYTPAYYDKAYDISKIKRVWYVVEPFSGIPGSAHTFLSFEFENNLFVSISVEIRKEQGESYDPIKGLLNKYELMYVIADEKDVIKLRSNYRKDQVYVYPGKTTPEKARELFLSMVTRANELYKNPEFYNTVTNTCTTNIVSHINKVTPGRVPMFNLSVMFPAKSDELAYTLGLIDTELSFEKSRERFYINDRALKYANNPNFSVLIRGEK
jgi:hypothetical protein